MKRIALIFLLLIPATARPWVPTTYYLSLSTNSPAGSNANDCLSTMTPCATYAYVADFLVPGDTLDVRGGTYPQWDNGAMGCSGCVDGTNLTEGSGAISVKAHTGETVIVRENIVSREYWRYIGINIDSNDQFNGLIVTTSNIYYAGVDDANRVEITKSLTDGCSSATYDKPNEQSGVHLQYFRIYDNGNRDPNPTHVPHHGCYWESKDGIVEDGEFDHNETFGIQFFNNTYTVLANIGHPTGNILRRVSFHHNSHGATLAATCDGCIVHSSLFYLNDDSGLDLQSGAGIKAYNNTIYGGGSSAGYGIQVIGSGAADIQGNVVYGFGTKDIKVWSSSGSTIAYNLTGNGVDDTLGTGDTVTGNETGDPDFVNAPTDFTPQATPPIGLGPNFYSTFTTDFNGDTRPSSGAWDAGAIQPTTSPTLISCAPNSGAQGASNLDVACVGALTNFVNMTTVCSVSGVGVSYVSATVIDSTHVTCRFNISGGATISSRNITVTTGGEMVPITNGFSVTSAPSPTISVVSPNTAAQITSDRTLTLTGSNTHWDGSCTFSLSDMGGINILSSTNNSATSQTVHLRIGSSASLTYRDVIMTCPGEVAQSLDGLLITYTQQSRFQAPFTWKQ